MLCRRTWQTGELCIRPPAFLRLLRLVRPKLSVEQALILFVALDRSARNRLSLPDWQRLCEVIFCQISLFSFLSNATVLAPGD